MKKSSFYIITVFILIFLITTPTFALEQIGYITATAGLKVRKDAGTSYGIVTTLKYNTEVIVTDTKKTSDSSKGCPSGNWYYITSASTKGYACTSYVNVVDNKEVSSSEIAKMTDAEFEDYLIAEGFPTSYFQKLKALHKSHPNWVFKGVKSKYTWANALSQQNQNGRSLYQVNSNGVKNGLQGYLNTDSAYYNYSTDKFVAKDGSTWFQASSQTIAYYMDPRNFLTESGIFMFEDLTYYKSYQNNDLIKKILYTDFYKDFIKYYIEAAEKHNVSPVYLSALSRQEVGLDSSTATSGKAGEYNGVNYNGYYNFYNIGASSGKNPVYNGLAYAKEAGWNTQQKAIVGGAEWIVNGYISKGQYTRYFQKWNTSPTTTTGIWHQYMTDIHALVGPSSTTAASYKSMGITNEALVFTIPIYEGIPVSTSLPPTGNPNNWLKDIKVDEKTIPNFKDSTTTYNLGNVPYTTSSIGVSTTTINTNASVDGDGKINLSVGKNTIKLLVTAQNGAKRTYTLTIIREEDPNKDEETEKEEEKVEEISISNILTNLSIKNNSSNIYGFKLGTTATTLSQNILKQNSNSIVKITDKNNKTKTNVLATGDKVTITSNKETKTYQVVIYGDVDGDGSINAKDLLIIRKYLLKEKSISGVYLEAAKLNRGTNVSAKDLLILRKYLLGTKEISQV